MTDAPTPRMVDHDALFSTLAQIQALEHQRQWCEMDQLSAVEDELEIQERHLKRLLCPGMSSSDPLPALAQAPSPAPASAPAEAEQAIETLLMQGRSSYMPTTYDLVITARADTVEGLGYVLGRIYHHIALQGESENHEENEYVGYLFKMLSPAQALAPAEEG